MLRRRCSRDPSNAIWRWSLADVIMRVAAVLIFLGLFAGLVRLVRGRTVIDRIVAIDMLTVMSISLITLYAHLSGRFTYLDVALVYGVLSFLGVLATARYFENGL